MVGGMIYIYNLVCLSFKVNLTLKDFIGADADEK